MLHRSNGGSSLMCLPQVCDLVLPVTFRLSDARKPDALLATIQQLVDSLTGLERILTTPIPFS